MPELLLHQSPNCDLLTSATPALRVIVWAAVGVLTTLGVTLTREAGVITRATLARAGRGALEKMEKLLLR